MNVDTLEFSIPEVTASICRDSLLEFVKEFWSTIIPEKPIWNWHIDVLCEELQDVAIRVLSGKPKRHDLIVNVPPGSTKSTIYSVMFTPWVWSIDPTIRTINGSYTAPLSLNLASLAREIVLSDKYRDLFPLVRLKYGGTKVSHFQTGKGGGRISTSTDGSITGYHGHLILIDDPINPKEALSDTSIKGTNQWIDQTLLTRKVDKKVTPLVLIMQRLHQNDPTGHLLEKKKEKIRHICLPATLSDKVNPPELEKLYKNDLLDPVRLDEGVLSEAKIDLGQYAYAGQYDQHPVPAEGGMFKADRLVITNAIPFKIKQVIRFWDKAATKDGGAYTAGVQMAELGDGSFIILDVTRGQWATDERERRIKQTAKIDGRTTRVVVEQEPGSAGVDSAKATIKNLAGFAAYADRPTGDKVHRADPFSVQVNMGNVYLLKGEWNKAFIDEMAFFPVGTYKDQVDASSGAFNRLAGRGKAGVW